MRVLGGSEPGYYQTVSGSYPEAGVARAASVVRLSMTAATTILGFWTNEADTHPH